MPKKYLSSKLIKFILVSAVCFVLIFLNPKGLFNPVKIVFLKMAYPFQKTFYMTSRSIDETLSFLGSIGKMRKDNENLIKENNYLNSQVASLRETKRENDLLREQLDLIPRGVFELDACFVIGQDPQGSGSWIVVSKGSSSGIMSGMPVIVSNGILIGRVEEVYADSSRVKLLTDSMSAVNVADLETGARGLVKGAYGLGMTMDMVAQTDTLNIGDTVITSGLGREVPRGLLIGKIQEIKLSPDKLFQQAVVVPRIKYQKLDVVFVIKNNNEK